ncbi:hypothetical protein FACS189434_00840 [Bacteroidia bacterium]|nr:hypothetical protein FACS189434_00840 [Bacteroidia bacterium]
MNENLFTINVKIAERSYPIRIEKENEQDMRKAADLLDDTISKFKKKYPAGETDSKISLIDHLIMAGMQIAFQYKRLEAQKDIDVLELENLANILNSNED